MCDDFQVVTRCENRTAQIKMWKKTLKITSESYEKNRAKILSCDRGTPNQRCFNMDSDNSNLNICISWISQLNWIWIWINEYWKSKKKKLKSLELGIIRTESWNNKFGRKDIMSRGGSWSDRILRETRGRGFGDQFLSQFCQLKKICSKLKYHFVHVGG